MSKCLNVFCTITLGGLNLELKSGGSGSASQLRVDTSSISQKQVCSDPSKNASHTSTACRTRHRRNHHAQIAKLAELHWFEYHHFFLKRPSLRTKHAVTKAYRKL